MRGYRFTPLSWGLLLALFGATHGTAETGGVVYAVSVAHVFTPEGSQSNVVLHVTNLYAMADVGYFNVDGIAIDPPDQSGAIRVEVVRNDVVADGDRNGVVDADDNIGEHRWTPSRGGYMVAAQVRDTMGTNSVAGLPPIVVREPAPAVDNAFFRLRLPQATAAEVILLDSQGRVVELSDSSVTMASNQVGDRVFFPLAAHARKGKPAATSFLYEFVAEWVRRTDSAVLHADILFLRTAPMILPWDGDPVLDIYVGEEFPASRLATLEPKVVNSFGERWLQDYFKIAQVPVASNAATDVVADLCATGSENCVGVLTADVAPALRRVEWHDAAGEGGNIVISPPYAGHPFGRAIVGSKHQKSVTYFDGQSIQTNCATLATRWLLVGHADEVVGFIATNKAIVADPRTAADMLHAAVLGGTATNSMLFGLESKSNASTRVSFMDLAVAPLAGGEHKLTSLVSSLAATNGSSTGTFQSTVFEVDDVIRIDDELMRIVAATGSVCVLERGVGGGPASNHATGTVAYALSDVLRVNLVGAEGLDHPAQYYVSQVCVQLTNALPGANVEIVKLPVLFGVGDDPLSGQPGFVACSANFVNCLHVPGTGTLMPDPGCEVMRQYVNTLVPATFVDVWDELHIHMGELHCATATRRQVPIQQYDWSNAR